MDISIFNLLMTLRKIMKYLEECIFFTKYDTPYIHLNKDLKKVDVKENLKISYKT